MRILTLPVLFFLGFSMPAFADFAKGFDAVTSGDYATALKEFEPLAEQGHAFAQYNLALMYENGQGVTQDYKTAVKWYKLAAEWGYLDAQYSLGVMYYEGHGVIQDYVRAHMWANIVASNGSENAVKLRTFFENKMTSSQVATAQNLAHECVAKNYKGC